MLNHKTTLKVLVPQDEFPQKKMFKIWHLAEVLLGGQKQCLNSQQKKKTSGYFLEAWWKQISLASPGKHLHNIKPLSNLWPASNV